MPYIVFDHMFMRGDGKRIQGRLYLPDRGEDKRYPVAVFSHGFGGNFRELEHYGPRFAEEGLAMCLFDFCGGGLQSFSDGDSRDMSVLTEMEDLRTVIKGLRKLSCIETEQIYLMGESQGGYVSALEAARYPEESAGLILWYPAFILEENARKWWAEGVDKHLEFWGLPLGEGYTKDAMELDIYHEIRGYGKRVLLIHGDRDDIVPISYSEKAQQIYPRAELKVIVGGGHGFDGQESLEAGRAAIEYIMTCLE